MTKRGQQKKSRAPKRKGSERLSPFGSIWSPQGSPRDPHERQKGAQEGPKTLSRPFSLPKRRFIKHQWIPIIKSRFLKLRRLSLDAQNRPSTIFQRLFVDFSRFLDDFRAMLRRFSERVGTIDPRIWATFLLVVLAWVPLFRIAVVVPGLVETGYKTQTIK